MTHDSARTLDHLLQIYRDRRDGAAIREVIDLTRPRLYALARRIAGTEQAEDVVQAAYLSLLRRARRPVDTPIWAYLITATVRLAYRHRAASQRLRAVPCEHMLEGDGPQPLRRLLRGERIARTRTAIAGLPPPYRDVVVLRHLEGRSVREIALLLDVPFQTAKTRLRRARALLRLKVERREGPAALQVLAAGLADPRVLTSASGGIMKAKSLALVTVVLISLGGVGAVLLTRDEPLPARSSASDARTRRAPELSGPSMPAPKAATSPGPDAAGRTGSPAPPGEEAAPEAAPRRVGGLRARLYEGLAAYLDAMEVPARVREEASSLGVSAATLRSMYAAEYLLLGAARQPGNAVYREAAEQALQELARAGEQGFLAVVANAMGNPHNTSQVDVMARATWQPGFEGDLLDRLAARDARLPAGAPMRLLGGMDSPAVREALIGALDRYANHASNFAAAAGALAALKDERVAAKIAPALRRRNWTGLHASLLDALGRAGGNRAKEVLIAYLRDRTSSVVSRALDALARIDPSAARAEAKALLDGVRGPRLDASERRRVERFLQER